MEYTVLGRTGLKVSVAGLGCGGPSRLGMRDDPSSEGNAVRLIKQAIDLGVNFLDTAQNYGTEGVVGKAIDGLPRDGLVFSTKKTLPPADHPDPEGEVRRGLEASLRLLGTDHIDIYHLHGVEPKDLAFARDRLLPVMRRLKDEGKIGFIGVTEGFVQDPAHTMLRDSLGDGLWDVVMVGFSMLNASARRSVLPITSQNGIGMLNMFAVRRALSRPERLKAMVGQLLEEGVLSGAEIDPADPLGFVLRDSDALTLPEAAYRFCRHEPGVDVVLSGTGNPAHLAENIAAILKPPLPGPVLERLARSFGQLDSLTGN